MLFMSTNRTFNKIGNTMILSFNMPENWKAKDLYKRLKEEIIKADAFSKPMIIDKDNNTKSDVKKIEYEWYYLKIFNYYDKNILPKIIGKCASCPYNEDYIKYHDFNLMLDEKIPVLVLRSKFIDFKEYDVYCSYFTDATEETLNGLIQLYGDILTFKKKCFRFLGLY